MQKCDYGNIKISFRLEQRLNIAWFWKPYLTDLKELGIPHMSQSNKKDVEGEKIKIFQEDFK